VRLRSVEGLQGVRATRLSLALRFGPPGHDGSEVDKSKDCSVKCFVELLQQRPGLWLPEPAGDGCVMHVVLPPLLLQRAALGGIFCRLKVLLPGRITPSSLCTSLGVSVPLELTAVPLMGSKGGAAVGTATLSIGRLLSLDTQVQAARYLVGQVFSELQRPRASPGPGAAQHILLSLGPSCGWSPGAGLDRMLATTMDDIGRGILRLAVDNGHSECIKPLVRVACDLRALCTEDLRSPLTRAIERGDEALQALVEGAEDKLTDREVKAARKLSDALGDLGAGGSPAATVDRWEALAETVARAFPPPRRHRPAAGDPKSGEWTSRSPASRGMGSPQSDGGPSASDKWSGDAYILALEHCPTGRARRRLLCADGACSALWCVCLSNNLPSLARKLAVWIGLSMTTSPQDEFGSPQSRRRLLDISLGPGEKEAMLARALERGAQDERWLKVARVMVHLGSDVTGHTASGKSLLDLALEKADDGHNGFRDLTASLLAKLGGGVDHWERPMVLVEDTTAECPICMENLWTSTPTAFVSFTTAGGREGNAHVICGHFFCFDCASQQYMKQQSHNVTEFECPICRAKATEVMPMPDIAVNPRLWFQFLDMAGSGKIEKSTVVHTLEAMLPIDTELLHAALAAGVWAEWDKDGDDAIAESEFFDAGGLLEWVRMHQHELKAAEARGKSPGLGDPKAWFRHWDTARRGRLRRGELLRALCEEASVSSLEPKRIAALKEGIQAIWDRHAVDDMLTRDSVLKTEAANELKALVNEVKK